MSYNFYQSQVRKHLNQDIFKKPSWEITIFGQQYQYIIREKKKRWLSLCWIQILWITDITHHSYQKRKQELQELQKKHNAFFIQLWSVDIVSTINTHQIHDETLVQSSKSLRIQTQKLLTSSGFCLSIKENLPPSTYYIDLTFDEEILKKDIHAQHLSKIKKAEKKWILVREATIEEHSKFHTILHDTWTKKWFWTVWFWTLEKVLDAWIHEWIAKLYVAVLWNDILAGAVYVFDKDARVAIYLYWWTNRKFNTISVWHILHWYIMIFAKHEGYKWVDLLWWWPTWYLQHHLNHVWFFKEGFGGTKIDYIWTFDIVYNPILYKTRVALRQCKNILTWKK